MFSAIELKKKKKRKKEDRLPIKCIRDVGGHFGNLSHPCCLLLQYTHHYKAGKVEVEIGKTANG